jgi:hypothetical protein
MMICNCSPTNVCQFHARLPRPCPSCGKKPPSPVLMSDGSTALRGQLEYHGKGAGRYVATIAIHPMRNHRPRRMARACPIWACNKCEHVEVA